MLQPRASLSPERGGEMHKKPRPSLGGEYIGAMTGPKESRTPAESSDDRKDRDLLVLFLLPNPRMARSNLNWTYAN